MTDQSAEIIDLPGAIAYLQALTGNISHTTDTELEVLLAGLAQVELNDDDVVGNIAAARDGLTAAHGLFTLALDRLLGEHQAVAETVAAAGGADAVARDSAFYGQG
ncbi:hypothetical protein Ga0074812_14834 [Parafrankia irregularis]|uniref:Excreted virulence factor EspC, type VII ESX diderm n=1 Tax=Parafrankia irregularis TaxID=795642 RepID=A0A0S4R0X5_9ACTN|nr:MULTISPECIES: hypothetical protein [Parafrankia]MBE3206759.1 hypothetical protein [Parafrankia sp. CH37]CUU60834.1 hypothetical protein Ga0074812_14834 [Parafrankia irregularis]